MNLPSAQIRFLTLARREVSRFRKIKRQTLGAPLLETFLYVSVFAFNHRLFARGYRLRG